MNLSPHMCRMTPEGFRGDSFAITPTVQSDTLTAQLQGTGDADAVALLESFLASAEEELLASRVHSVAFDVRELYLLNTRMLKGLASFVLRLGARARRGQVRFVVDPKLGWQRRSLKGMMRLAPNLVVIDDG